MKVGSRYSCWLMTADAAARQVWQVPGTLFTYGLVVTALNS